jgi:hypothetical protein
MTVPHRHAFGLLNAPSELLNEEFLLHCISPLLLHSRPERNATACPHLAKADISLA